MICARRRHLRGPLAGLAQWVACTWMGWHAVGYEPALLAVAATVALVPAGICALYYA